MSAVFKKMILVFTLMVTAVLFYAIYMLRPIEMESIKIGTILPLSGTAYYIGNEIKDGMLLAVDEINTAGGINGRNLDLIIKDSKTDPKEGRMAFDRIEEEHRPLLYVSALDSVSSALIPFAEVNKVVLVGLAVSDPLFTKKSEWVFKYYLQASEEVLPIISILKSLGLKKLGVLYLDDQYGLTVFELLSSEFEKIGGKTEGQSFGLDEINFLSRIRELGANEAIYSVGLENHFRNIFSQLKRENYGGIVLGSSAASVPFVRSVPEADGVYVAAPITYNENFLSAKEVNDKYLAKYGKEPNHFAANGYDFIKIIKNLLEDREDITRQGVRDLLEEKFLYTGVFGVIDAIKSGSHDITFKLYPARVERGRLNYSR